MNSILIKRIINDAVFVLFLLICIGAIRGNIRHHITGETIDIWGIKPVLIESGSMEPSILTNSIVLVRKTTEVEPDDILMFSTGINEFVVHRFIRKNSDGTYITKGDRNEIEDGIRLDESDIYGKVIIRMNILAPLITFIKNIPNTLKQ